MRILKQSTFITVLVLAATVSLYAQSDVDTFVVVECSGAPGGTVVVPINMVNTFRTSGIQFRIRFDPQILHASAVDTAGTRVSGIYTDFPTAIDNDSGCVRWIGINFYNPYENYVIPGSGPVAYVLFEIDPGAPGGCQTEIRFEDDPVHGYYNHISDRYGNMVFPVQTDGEVQVVCTGIEERVLDVTQLPEFFFLDRASPNPFSNSTAIRYGVPRSQENSSVSLRVFNSSGSLIRTLLNERQTPGWHILKWNGKNDSGTRVSGGVYFCRMEVDGKCLGLRKIVHLK